MQPVPEPEALNAIAEIAQNQHQIDLTGFEAFTVIAGIQLCLRHPGISPAQAQILEIVGRNIQAVISSDPQSAIYRTMEMGWHTKHDMEASAPACGGHGHTGVAINPSARMDYEDIDPDSQYDGY